MLRLEDRYHVIRQTQMQVTMCNFHQTRVSGWRIRKMMRNTSMVGEAFAPTDHIYRIVYRIHDESPNDAHRQCPSYICQRCWSPSHLDPQTYRMAPASGARMLGFPTSTLFHSNRVSRADDPLCRCRRCSALSKPFMDSRPLG